MSLEPPTSVTLDQHVFRGVCSENTRDDEIAAIAALIREGRIKPYVSETVFSLEGIPRKKRADFLAARRVRCIEVSDANSRRYPISQRRDLAEQERTRLQRALNLGFEILHCPRFFQFQPQEVRNAGFAKFGETLDDYFALAEKFGEVVDALEARGLGLSQVKRIAEHVPKAEWRGRHWFQVLADRDFLNDNQREGELAAAVAEWSDTDSVAAHFAYGLDAFCTRDRASKDKKISVFNKESRNWLRDEFNICILSPKELVKRLST